MKIAQEKLLICTLAPAMAPASDVMLLDDVTLENHPDILDVCPDPGQVELFFDRSDA